MTETEEIELFYQAINSEFGLAIQISDPSRYRLRLYQLKRKLADPALADLQFRLSPYRSDELWLIQAKGKKNGTPI